jgi:hypothetical protein
MNALWPSALYRDTRIVYIEKRRRWWWNAWRASTATELYGFADSREQAQRQMFEAIEQEVPSPVLGESIEPTQVLEK